MIRSGGAEKWVKGNHTLEVWCYFIFSRND